MNTKDLELYYFNTASLEEIRFKHFPIIKQLFNSEDLLNNKDISEDESLSKRAKIESVICDYIKSNENISKEFYEVYHIDKPNEICELVLQGIIANEVIKQKLDINIFLDKASVIYFENKYPRNIIKWQKDKTYTIEKYCEDVLELYDLFNMFPAEEIFGEDIVRECEQLIKEYEEKKK